MGKTTERTTNYSRGKKGSVFSRGNLQHAQSFEDFGFEDWDAGAKQYMVAGVRSWTEWRDEGDETPAKELGTIYELKITADDAKYLTDGGAVDSSNDIMGDVWVYVAGLNPEEALPLGSLVSGFEKLAESEDLSGFSYAKRQRLDKAKRIYARLHRSRGFVDRVDVFASPVQKTARAE